MLQIANSKSKNKSKANRKSKFAFRILTRLPSNTVDITDRQAFEKRNDEKWEVASKTVHQLKYIATSAISKAH